MTEIHTPQQQLDALDAISQHADAQGDKDYEKLANGPHVHIESLSNNPDWVKCPRCWHYHTILLNHQGLCDRCCWVLLTAWPNDDLAIGVLDNWKRQDAYYNRIQRSKGLPEFDRIATVARLAAEYVSGIEQRETAKRWAEEQRLLGNIK